MSKGIDDELVRILSGLDQISPELLESDRVRTSVHMEADSFATELDPLRRLQAEYAQPSGIRPATVPAGVQQFAKHIIDRVDKLRQDAPELAATPEAELLDALGRNDWAGARSAVRKFLQDDARRREATFQNRLTKFKEKGGALPMYKALHEHLKAHHKALSKLHQEHADGLDDDDAHKAHHVALADHHAAMYAKLAALPDEAGVHSTDRGKAIRPDGVRKVVPDIPAGYCSNLTDNLMLVPRAGGPPVGGGDDIAPELRKLVGPE